MSHELFRVPQLQEGTGMGALQLAGRLKDRMERRDLMFNAPKNLLGSIVPLVGRLRRVWGNKNVALGGFKAPETTTAKRTW